MNDTIEALVATSAERYGAKHTHDLGCQTWTGKNWAGACDCSLPDRTRGSDES